MSNAGQHLQPGISKRRDELTATFLDVRDVEITAQNVHPHCDLFESAAISAFSGTDTAHNECQARVALAGAIAQGTLDMMWAACSLPGLRAVAGFVGNKGLIETGQAVLPGGGGISMSDAISNTKGNLTGQALQLAGEFMKPGDHYKPLMTALGDLSHAASIGVKAFAFEAGVIFTAVDYTCSELAKTR